MCAVSVIYDLFASQPESWYTLDRIDLFKKMIANAEQLDIETGESDCVDPEKAKLKEKIEDLEAQLSEYKGADHE